MSTRSSGGLAEAVTAVAGSAVRSARPVGGGDTSAAHRVDLADGRVVFVKSGAGAPADSFAAEAAGLDWLREAGALRVPRVVGVGAHEDTGAILVLEWIEQGPPAADHDEVLGGGLAALHRAGAAHFGLVREDGSPFDNRIGPLPQRNAPHDTWAAFYAHERLLPLAAEAVSRGLLPGEARGRFEALAARLPDLYPRPEPPARLHGDLWAGNAIADEAGAPVLVDPAAYGGHREMDLAMMRLFGGFGTTVFAAYDEAHPLLDGHRERVALHQLYPLLVHTLLFGGSYADAVLRALSSYA